MRERRWLVPYLDITQILYFLFVVLFTVTLIVIGDEASKAKIDSTSRYIVTMTWDDASRDDIDLSVKVPSGEIVYFRVRQAQFASLDRDDLGIDQNTVIDDAGNAVTLRSRSEVIYVRQTIPGVYTFNVHAYSKKDPAPAHVRITLTSVGDRTQVLQTRELTLTEEHEERTAFRMTVDPEGNARPDLVEEMFINSALGHEAGSP